MLAHNDGVRAVVAALALGGSLGKLVVQYLGCFKPAKSRLTPAKQAAVLEELIPMINAGAFMRRGASITAPRAAWEAGIEAVLEQVGKKSVALPLAGHGYLLEIIARSAEQQAAKQEAKREASRAHAGQVRRFDERAQDDGCNEDGCEADDLNAPKHTLPTAEQAAAIKASIAAISKRMTGAAE